MLVMIGALLSVHQGEVDEPQPELLQGLIALGTTACWPLVSTSRAVPKVQRPLLLNEYHMQMYMSIEVRIERPDAPHASNITNKTNTHESCAH